MPRTIEITAFKLRNDPNFYDAMSGHQLPDNYAGYCQVGLSDTTTAIFKTGINEYSERYWIADGNNPKKDFCFGSYKEGTTCKE